MFIPRRVGVRAVGTSALALSQAGFREAVERLDGRGIRHRGVKDHGFMDSICFRGPLGLRIELASYRSEPPWGHAHADVLFEADPIRTERGDDHIDTVHLANALEALVQRSHRSVPDRSQVDHTTDAMSSDRYQAAVTTTQPARIHAVWALAKEQRR